MIKDVLWYVSCVKVWFESSPQIYRDFVKILKDYNNQRYVIHFVFEWRNYELFQWGIWEILYDMYPSYCIAGGQEHNKYQNECWRSEKFHFIHYQDKE